MVRSASVSLPRFLELMHWIDDLTVASSMNSARLGVWFLSCNYDIVIVLHHSSTHRSCPSDCTIIPILPVTLVYRHIVPARKILQVSKFASSLFFIDARLQARRLFEP
jgi:hypothetical protein